MFNLRNSFTVLFVSASLTFSPCFAAEPETAALQMVKALRLGDNLGALGFHAASRTVTYQMIIKTVGSEKARALVTEELDKAKPKYQERWDKNLAASYALLFSADEFQSIAEKQKQSPYLNKFLSKQNEVGSTMQSKSSGLLTEYVTEALGNAFRKTAPTK